MKTTLDYLLDAYQYASWQSDDPRTQNGAILVKDNKIIGMGVNRLPRGIEKLEKRLERPTKYQWIEHAERNAIFMAAREGHQTEGATLYCPWFACCDCARGIIEAGISKIIGHKQVFEQYGEGPWTESINIGNQMFKEAGIITELYDGPINTTIEIILNGEKWKP
jgi:dCMP deaminase